MFEREFSRTDRVKSMLHKELAILLRDALKDPRIDGVSISWLKLSPDMGVATVYVNNLDEKRVEASVEALNHAAGFLRARLGRILKLRSVPHLRFHRDEAQERGARIDALLAKVARKH